MVIESSSTLSHKIKIKWAKKIQEHETRRFCYFHLTSFCYYYSVFIYEMFVFLWKSPFYIFDKSLSVVSVCRKTAKVSKKMETD